MLRTSILSLLLCMLSAIPCNAMNMGTPITAVRKDFLYKKAMDIKNHPDCEAAKKAALFDPDSCFVLHHVANAAIEKMIHEQAECAKKSIPEQKCVGLNLTQVDSFISDLKEHNSLALSATIQSKYGCWDEVKSLERECKRRTWDKARGHEIYMDRKYPFWNGLLKNATQKDKSRKQ